MVGRAMTRRRFWFGAGAVTVGILARPAGAQGYPSRPVRFVLPFAAGGVADITARLAADKLGEKLGQRFVVENQPGPGGIAAARSVLSQPADGHALGLVTNGTAISAAIYKALPFDPVKQFANISTIGAFDLVFATNADSAIKSLADLIKGAREEPGKLNVGTIAVGSIQNLGAELFRAEAGVKLQIVPYRTTPDVIVALLRNDIQLMIDFYAAMKGPLDDKKIRPVGTSGPRRSPFLPEVPTVGETVAGYEVTSWNGLFARMGTPAQILDLLNRSIHEVVAIPEVKQRYAELGIEARASTPAQLQARLEADIKKWSGLIDRAGIERL
jgi:tripartite-type tricarboxylate transporter receptor subunit TctC